MSTTVSYKGQNIATVSNNTKTLETEGKYLEADIILTDSSQAAPVIDSLTVTPTTSQQTYNSSSVDGYKPVVVNAMPSGSIGNPNVSRSKDTSSYMATVTYPNFNAGYISSISAVGVPFYIQEETVTPSTSTQTVTPTSDMYYLDEVTVNPIPSEYIIPSGTYTVSSSGTADITNYASLSVPSGSAGSPALSVSEVSNHSVTVRASTIRTEGWIPSGTVQGASRNISASDLVSGTKSITSNGTGIDVTNYASVDVAVPSSAPNLQSKTHNVSSAGTTTVTADSGYDGLDEVEVSVPSADILPWEDNWFATESGSRKWITETGYVLNGGSVSAGWVSDNDILETKYNAIPTGTSVTPTESAQTIGGAKTMMEGAVTVNAISSNYVGSGITRRDSTDLTASGATVSVPSGFYENNASKAIANGSATASATKGAVSNHSVTVTPSVTRTAGYITAGSANGTAVTVSASELVSGSETKTANGTYDVTNLAELVVNVSGGGGTSKNTQVVQGTTRTTSSTLTAIGAELTVSKTGTYDVYWSAFRSSTSSSYTYGTQLYVGGVAYGTQNTTWSNHVQNNHLTNVSLTANQKIRVYGRNSRGSSYYIYAPTLVIVEN